MKTTELREYYRILSELNNSFTRYSLVWNQFSIDYAEILTNIPDTLTKDYFENNPYKRKHNIKLGELEAEHNKTHDTLIKGIFLLIYTHFESYLKGLLIFSNKVDDSIQPLESKGKELRDVVQYPQIPRCLKEQYDFSFTPFCDFDRRTLGRCSVAKNSLDEYLKQ